MKRFCQIAAAVLLVAISVGISVAQAVHADYDHDTQPASSKPRDGFLDFTLRHINSSDTNYGQCLSEDRRMLLEATLRDAYFWSNIVALGVLGWLFLVIIYQQKGQIRRDWMTAEIVTELEQSVTRSRAQLVEAGRKNDELKNALVALKESTSRPPSVPAESTERAGSPAEKHRTLNTQSGSTTTPRTNSAKPVSEGSSRSTTGKDPAGQMRLFTPDADFVMKLNSLEQQLAQSREDNKQLRRRISVSDRRLEAEPGGSRQLEDA
jgi:hypothetical protein